jgi:hypothetical protein
MESQNAIARRRVRELEMELETCKEDVRRERTRVLESEEVDALRSIDDGAIARRSAKGKAKEKSREVSFEFDRGKRYREVVEEKKGELHASMLILHPRFTSRNQLWKRCSRLFVPISSDSPLRCLHIESS